MVEAVLLDLDGTLLDTNYLHVEAWARAFQDLGRPVPRAAIHRQIGKGADQFLPEFLDDAAERERADQYHGACYGDLTDQAYALPGAADLLRALAARGVQAWLASSAQPEELERVLPKLGARECLSGVVCAEDVAASKPAADVFAATLARAGVAPAAAVALGDTVWDIAAAARAGVRTVAVLTGGAYLADELRAAGAVAVYRDCADALAADFPAGL